MGRHSDGKNNYSLSAGAIVAVVVVIALIVAGVWWLLQRDGSSANGEEAPAAEGRECTLVPIHATDDAVGELVVAGLSGESEDGEECTDVELVDSLDDAALLIAPDSPDTEQLLADAGRETEGEPVAVASSPVGLSGAEETEATDVDPADVSFPTDAQPEAAQLVADALGAEGDLSESPDASWTATTQGLTPDGETFSPIDDLELVFHAFPLTETDTVSAQQVDAAAGLAATAGDGYEGPDTSSEVEESAAPTTEEAAPEEQEETQAAAELVPNTLFLLDTSEAMTPYADAAAASIGDAAVAATDAGNLAGLWNYSSPLNPGVTDGWRRNITYTDAGDDIAWAAERFGNAGQAQTRSAVLAAVGNARDQANETGQPARVVLVTSGTAGDMGDEQFRSALEQAGDDNVQLSVVHVGPGEPDAVLQEAAGEFLTAEDGAGISQAVQQATGA